MRILILGSTGMLGLSLKKFLLANNQLVVSHGNKFQSDISADISSEIETNKLLDRIEPDLIINLIALTDVDFCESNPNSSFLHNTKTVSNVASWIIKTNPSCKLIHISSDQLYDGCASSLNKESDVCIRNYYALCKYASELEVYKCGGMSLRTNFFGKSIHSERKSITDWILNAINERKEISVFDDVFFTPLSINTLCKAILFLISNPQKGSFNLGSRKGMSKAEFAFKFASLIGYIPENWNKISVDLNKNLIACRPKNMMMDSKKFENYTNFKLPSIDEELKKVAEEYHEN